MIAIPLHEVAVEKSGCWRIVNPLQSVGVVMMNVFRSVMLLMGSLFALTACGKGPEDMVVRDNPAPKHAYRVVADLRALPSQPKAVVGYVNFENKWSGTVCPTPHMVRWEIRVPWAGRQIAMTQTEPGVYEGMFYLDHLLDEKYFDRGLCAWRLNTVGISFAGDGGRSFGASIGHTTLKDGAEDVAFYPVGEWSKPISDTGIDSAYSVPTDDFKKDPANSYVNDASKYFPVRISVHAVEGTKGLTVRQEFQQRTGQDLE